jgi:hypothetical protein
LGSRLTDMPGGGAAIACRSRIMENLKKPLSVAINHYLFLKSDIVATSVAKIQTRLRYRNAPRLDQREIPPPTQAHDISRRLFVLRGLRTRQVVCKPLI